MSRVIGRMLLIVVGFLSLVWFLARVIPKPSRAAYPCQRAAFPVASAFVVWMLGVLGTAWAWRRGKMLSRHALSFRAWCCYGVAALAACCAVVHWPQSPVQASLPLKHGPLGTGQGIHPGRVVWVHAPDATDWAGESSSETWWQTNHTDLAVVETMFSKAIRTLAGEPNDAASWEALFTDFNQRQGRGRRGYQSGEKIAIKINLTTCNGASTTTYEKPKNLRNAIDNSPQMILSLLRHLVYVVRVPPNLISLGDPTGLFPNYLWNLLHPEFPDVHYFDTEGGLGRVRTEFSSTPFYWSTAAANGKRADYVPVPFAEANYIINFAILKGHSSGITFCGKNHYGSLLRTPVGGLRGVNFADYYNLHLSLPNAEWSPGMGHYRAIVDLMGHRELGGKTFLYLVDGLFAGYYWDSRPYLWKTSPFGDGTTGDWPSSLFASQDPVAIDSVAHDFLLNEWPRVVSGGTGAPGSLQGGAEDYLHEAALADNPPSGSFYDPEKDGMRLSSLGAHEHWNNPTDRQYSRNRGIKEGIELVSLRVDREPPRLLAQKTGPHLQVSWPSAHAGYMLESTTSLMPPIHWTPVLEPSRFYQGQNVITNSSPDSPQFYRLVK